MCTRNGIVVGGKLLYAGSIQDAYARVSSGERVAVTLENDGASIDDVIAAISRHPIVALASRENGQLVIDLHAGTKGHHELIQALVACGARIGAFTPRQIKLEDAFLRLT